MSKDKQYMVPGTLHLSSRVIYGSSKNGVIKKFTSFYPFQNKYTSFYVKTSKSNARDMYCIIKYTGTSKDETIATGTVAEWIGEVGDPVSEEKYLKYVCCCTWSNDKLFKDIYDRPDGHDNYASSRKTQYETTTIYSIDPENCTDVDDAIHVCKNEYGYEIGIHIADVSSYIAMSSPLDTELAERCESVYLKGCQVNMLPQLLVNKCSLLENEWKRSFSIFVQLNDNYEMVSYKFSHCTIKVTKNLTYDEAQYIICNKLNENLTIMYEIARNLSGERDHYDTHKMVETYMLLANTLVAEHLARTNERSIYRCQTGSRKKKYEYMHEECLVRKANQLLMSRAEYVVSNGKPTDKSHIGLNKDVYTHFTSPIRRYADILVHRILHSVESGEPVEYYSEDIINKINEKHSLYNRCERLSDQLSRIYLLRDTYGDSLYTKGNIVEINENLRVKIYLKEFDLVVDCKLISEKLTDLITTTYNTEDDIEVIKMASAYGEISFRMFEEVDITVAITMSLKHKLLTQVPSVKCLFDQFPFSPTYNDCFSSSE